MKSLSTPWKRCRGRSPSCTCRPSKTFILRVFLVFGGLLLAGLGVAFLITRNRRYLKIAWLAIQIMGLLAIGFALLYIFQRVLLI